MSGGQPLQLAVFVLIGVHRVALQPRRQRGQPIRHRRRRHPVVGDADPIHVAVRVRRGVHLVLLNAPPRPQAHPLVVRSAPPKVLVRRQLHLVAEPAGRLGDGRGGVHRQRLQPIGLGRHPPVTARGHSLQLAMRVRRKMPLVGFDSPTAPEPHAVVTRGGAPKVVVRRQLHLVAEVAARFGDGRGGVHRQRLQPVGGCSTAPAPGVRLGRHIAVLVKRRMHRVALEPGRELRSPALAPREVPIVRRRHGGEVTVLGDGRHAGRTVHGPGLEAVAAATPIVLRLQPHEPPQVDVRRVRGIGLEPGIHGHRRRLGARVFPVVQDRERDPLAVVLRKRHAGGVVERQRREAIRCGRRPPAQLGRHTLERAVQVQGRVRAVGLEPGHERRRRAGARALPVHVWRKLVRHAGLDAEPAHVVGVLAAQEDAGSAVGGVGDAAVPVHPGRHRREPPVLKVGSVHTVGRQARVAGRRVGGRPGELPVLPRVHGRDGAVLVQRRVRGIGGVAADDGAPRPALARHPPVDGAVGQPPQPPVVRGARVRVVGLEHVRHRRHRRAEVVVKVGPRVHMRQVAELVRRDRLHQQEVWRIPHVLPLAVLIRHHRFLHNRARPDRHRGVFRRRRPLDPRKPGKNAAAPIARLPPQRRKGPPQQRRLGVGRRRLRRRRGRQFRRHRRHRRRRGRNLRRHRAERGQRHAHPSPPAGPKRNTHRRDELAHPAVERRALGSVGHPQLPKVLRRHYRQLPPFDGVLQGEGRRRSLTLRQQPLAHLRRVPFGQRSARHRPNSGASKNQ